MRKNHGYRFYVRAASADAAMITLTAFITMIARALVW